MRTPAPGSTSGGGSGRRHDEDLRGHAPSRRDRIAWTDRADDRSPGHRSYAEVLDPVFVDTSGRRRLMIKLVGAAGSLALAVVLVVLTLAVSGASPIAIPGLPAVRHAAPRSPSAPAPTRTDGQSSVTGPRSGGPTVTAPPSPTPGPASPTASKRGHVPTQTPSHPSKSH
jgi:hypothetical protein